MNRVRKAEAQLERNNPLKGPSSTPAQTELRSNRQGCHLLGVSLLFVALTVLSLFIILVNICAPFARACGGAPAVGGFGKAVMFSPSMRAAVKNGAVQDIDSVQTKSGITLHLWYLIADGERLSISYSVKGMEEANCFVKPRISVGNDDTPLPINVILAENAAESGSGLHTMVLDFGKARIPGSLLLTCTVSNGHDAQSGPQDSNYATFKFPIEFDPSPTTK